MEIVFDVNVINFEEKILKTPSLLAETYKGRSKMTICYAIRNLLKLRFTE
jgi:hypothetical protein